MDKVYFEIEDNEAIKYTPLLHQDIYACPECGQKPYYNYDIYNYNICPFCGAKIVEQTVAESEVV